MGAVLLEGDKVARVGCDSRLGYRSVDPPHRTRVVPEGLPQDTTIDETNNVNPYLLCIRREGSPSRKVHAVDQARVPWIVSLYSP